MDHRAYHGRYAVSSGQRPPIRRRAPSLELVAALAREQRAVTQRMIADALHVSQQRASQLVYRLVALGVLAPDPGSQPRAWRSVAQMPELNAPAPPLRQKGPAGPRDRPTARAAIAPGPRHGSDLPAWLQGL